MNQAANMLDDSSAQCYNKHGPLEKPAFKQKKTRRLNPVGFFLFRLYKELYRFLYSLPIVLL